MATILNDPYAEDQSISTTMASGMPAEVENVFSDIRTQAIQLLKKRKPYYDFETRNKSFIQLYSDLKKLGIKNNKFFLKLYDRDLIGVNPYSLIPPPIEIQLKIHLECMLNPWYYIREVARIVDPGKPIEPGGGIAFIADRGNIASWYLYLNGFDQYDSKPRQCGKTQNAVCEFLYAYLYGAVSSNILFFNKTRDDAILNLSRLKDQREMLPIWMQMRDVVTEDGRIDKGTNNVTAIQNPVTRNMIVVMPKASNKESATKLGRGATAPLQYLDEFDYTPYQTEIMDSAVFAFRTASRNAKANKSLFGRVLTSTPGDTDSRDGKAATEYTNRMLVWDDSYYDITIEELDMKSKSEKRIPIIFVEHTWRQLKKSMQWYEEGCRDVGYNEEKILREIELHRISGSDRSPFDRKAILYITSHKKDPIEKIDYTGDLYPFMIYEKLNPLIPYILSVDPAEGLGSDNNACTFINPYTQKPVVEFQCPYISQKKFSEILIKFMDTYVPKCMIVVESNRGRELIQYFLDSQYRYQVYYDDNKLDKAPVETVGPGGRMRREAAERRAYGFTTGSNRHQLFAILENIMQERRELILTNFLVKDTAGLVRMPGTAGRIEAGAGFHDDNIMSYLIGLFVYYNAPYELLIRFGITRGKSSPYEEEVEMTEKEVATRLKELSMSADMPDELRDIIRSASQDDHTDEVTKYYKEVQRLEQQMDQPSAYGAGGMPQRQDSPPILNDDSFWDKFDRQIVESNFDNDRYEVNIEDYI